MDLVSSRAVRARNLKNLPRLSEGAPSSLEGHQLIKARKKALKKIQTKQLRFLLLSNRQGQNHQNIFYQIKINAKKRARVTIVLKFQVEQF
jgi:hypothetical protein